VSPSCIHIRLAPEVTCAKIRFLAFYCGTSFDRPSAILNYLGLPLNGFACVYGRVLSLHLMLLDDIARRASYKAHSALSRSVALASLRRHQHHGVANTTQHWKWSQPSKSNQLKPIYDKEQHVDVLFFDAQRFDVTPPKHPGIPALIKHVQSSVVIQDNTVTKLLPERKSSVDELAENKSSDLTIVHTGSLEATTAPAEQDNLATHSVITHPQSATLEAKSEPCQLRRHDIALNIHFYYHSGSLLATPKPHYFKRLAPSGPRSFQPIKVTSFTEALNTIRFGDPAALYFDSVVAGLWHYYYYDSHTLSGQHLKERWSYFADMLLFIHGYNYLKNVEKEDWSRDDQRYRAITRAFQFLYTPRILGYFLNGGRARSLRSFIGGRRTAHSYARVLQKFERWHYREVGLQPLPGPASTSSRSIGNGIKEPLQDSQPSRPDEGQNDGEVVPEQMQKSQPRPPDEGDHDGRGPPGKGLKSRLAAAFPDLPLHILSAIATLHIGMERVVMKYSRSGCSGTTVIRALALVKDSKQRSVRQIEKKVRACTGSPRRIKELRFQAEHYRMILVRVDDLIQTLRALERPESSRLEQGGLKKNPLNPITPLHNRITSWESLPAAAKVDFDQGNLFKLNRLKTLSRTLDPYQRAFVWSQVIRQLGAKVARHKRTGPQSAAQSSSQSLKRIRIWIQSMVSQQNFPHDLTVSGKLLKLPNRFTGKIYANEEQELKAVELLISIQKATVRAISSKVRSLIDVGKWYTKEANSRQLSQDLNTANFKLGVIRTWLKEAQSTSDNLTTDPQLASIDASLPYEILHYVFEDALYQLKLAMFYYGRREFPQVMADNKWHSPENVSIMDFILNLRQDPDVKRRLDFCADEVRYVKDMHGLGEKHTLTSHSDM